MMESARYLAALPEPHFLPKGRLIRSVGMLLESTGPALPVGALAVVEDGNGGVICEVVGFRDDRLLLLAIDKFQHLAPRSPVAPLHLTFKAGPWMLGRVLDGLGRPLDGGSAPSQGEAIELEPPALQPMARGLSSAPLDVGVRAINGLFPIAVGQKIGVFSMPGVGKSVLLGMIARGTSADSNVIALIGERGREAREFIEDILGAEGLKRSVAIVVTGDMPAPMRLKGTILATAIANYLRRQGNNVLLLMDSLTRVAMAQREVGLASGEPPTARGYPPSVFALIPRLVETAGTREAGGSITGIYTVLLHEENDTVGELAKSVLDGHIVLSRELAGRGHYPAIEVSTSVSRLAPRISSPEHNGDRLRFLELYVRWREAEELMALGTYHAGHDRRADEAVRLHEKLESFLKQPMDERVSFAASLHQLSEAIQ